MQDEIDDSRFGIVSEYTRRSSIEWSDLENGFIDDRVGLHFL